MDENELTSNYRVITYRTYPTSNFSKEIVQESEDEVRRLVREKAIELFEQSKSDNEEMILHEEQVADMFLVSVSSKREVSIRGSRFGPLRGRIEQGHRVVPVGKVSYCKL